MRKKRPGARERRVSSLLLLFLVEAFLELGELFVVCVKVVLLSIVGCGPGIGEFLVVGIPLERLACLVPFFGDLLVADEELGVVGLEFPLSIFGGYDEFLVVGVALAFFAGPFQGGLFASVGLFLDGRIFLEEILF